MMMGFMVGKGLMGFDDHEKKEASLPIAKIACAKCSNRNDANN